MAGLTTQVIPGQTKWSMARDEDGHRNYAIQFRVVSSTGLDGPANVLQTPGLPRYGDVWAFDNDVDIWAWCRWNADVKSYYDTEPGFYWTVDFVFSTKPNNCCRQVQIEDPLLQPIEISGGSNKYTEEATEDRKGKKITNSALEQIKGPTNEWDANRGNIKIKQYVADLQLDLCESMRDTVNDAVLWGQDKRKIKLTSFSWEQKFYGNCNVYYIRNFEFDINPKTWDRDILDEGTKALNGHHSVINGHWLLDDINGVTPDPTNPLHFKAYQDRAGNTTKVILDGHGKPYIPLIPTAGAATKWWALVTNPARQGFLQESFLLNSSTQGTCADAVAYAQHFGVVKIDGPFSTQEAAETFAATESAYDDATLVEDWDCSGVDNSNEPGKIHVEKHEESNFLLLGLPTNF